jgi:hypothetical protein
VFAVPARSILLNQPTDHTTAWIALAGAIVVALVAAGTAQWRLRTQLAHERTQTDLADLRDILGNGLAATGLARQSAIDAYRNPLNNPFPLTEIQAMETWLNRLRIRLGRDDAIVTRYSKMADTVHALSRLAPEPGVKHDQILAMPEMQVFGQAYNEYVDLAQRRAGSSLPTTPKST